MAIKGPPPHECEEIEYGTGYDVQEEAVRDWLREYLVVEGGEP
jgi:hypothetical protein